MCNSSGATKCQENFYLITKKEPTRAVYDIVTENIKRNAGVEANLGKTECWSKAGGVPPPGMNDLGAPDQPPIATFKQS